MTALARTPLLVASTVFGAVLMLLLTGGLIRVVRWAVVHRQPVRGKMFWLILGIVVSAWFFTYGVLCLVFGL